MPEFYNELSLLDLTKQQAAIVVCVRNLRNPDPIGERLRELGFVEGERIVLLALGPFGREPLMVLVGSARFALRRAEASRIIVKPIE